MELIMKKYLALILMFACLCSAAVHGADDATPQAAKDKAADKAPADNDASLDDLLKLTDPKKPDDKTKPVLPEVAAPSLTGNESVDMLLKVISEMDQVAQRLRVRQDPGLDTQRIQESILKRLDEAIASAQKQKQEQQQQQNQPGSSQQKQETGSPQNQQKPGQQKPDQKPGDKQEQKGDNKGQEQNNPQNADANTPNGPIEESRIEWGRLPARIRGELDQGLGEKFSPIYKKLTEAYYRRLAEEGKE